MKYEISVILFIIVWPSKIYACTDQEYCAKKESPINNVIFEGGGAQAISFIGALKAFEAHGYFENNRYSFGSLSGTSTGCLAALFVSLDIAPNALETEIFKSNIISRLLSFDIEMMSLGNLFHEQKTTGAWYKLFMTSYNLLVQLSRLVEMWLMHDSPGLSTDEQFMDFITTTILPLSQHGSVMTANLTFEELYTITGHKLTCYATTLRDNSAFEFSTVKTPFDNVFKAVYASMTIPGVFKPLSDKVGFPLIDGGFVNNFPIYSFDTEGIVVSNSTIGLSLAHKRLKPRDAIKNTYLAKTNKNYQFSKITTIEYMTLLQTFLHEQSIIEYSTNEKNENRIIYLESPLLQFEFNQNPALMSLAINRAYLNAFVFLNERRKANNNKLSDNLKT